jgi:hypothetical protein
VITCQNTHLVSNTLIPASLIILRVLTEGPVWDAEPVWDVEPCWDEPNWIILLCLHIISYIPPRNFLNDTCIFFFKYCGLEVDTKRWSWAQSSWTWVMSRVLHQEYVHLTLFADVDPICIGMHAWGRPAGYFRQNRSNLYIIQSIQHEEPQKSEVFHSSLEAQSGSSEHGNFCTENT